MKSFKVLVLFFAIFFMSVNTTFAQSNTADLTEEQKEEMKKNIEEYFVSLNLSDEQKLEFESITKKYALQMKGLKGQEHSQMEKFQAFQSIQESKNNELKKLLTDKQYKVYEDKQAEIRKKFLEKREG